MEVGAYIGFGVILFCVFKGTGVCVCVFVTPWSCLQVRCTTSCGSLQRRRTPLTRCREPQCCAPSCLPTSPTPPTTTASVTHRVPTAWENHPYFSQILHSQRIITVFNVLGTTFHFPSSGLRTERLVITIVFDVLFVRLPYLNQKMTNKVFDYQKV